MFSLFISDPSIKSEPHLADAQELLIAELWEAGVAGIVETSDGLRAFFEDDADAGALSARFGGVLSGQIEERDWIAESRNFLQPAVVGKRFYLVPEWRNDPAPDDRISIRVNSGLAFGTGAHESTRLCLEALEDLITPGITVADVGTGSGILAEAAKLLGAGRVIACDIDPLAVAVARANFERAQLAIELFEGSIQNIASGVAAVAVGNISPEWVSLLAPEWVRVLQPGGSLLVSGFETSDVPRIQDRMTLSGLRLEQTRDENRWRALIFRKSSGDSRDQKT